MLTKGLAMPNPWLYTNVLLRTQHTSLIDELKMHSSILHGSDNHEYSTSGVQTIQPLCASVNGWGSRSPFLTHSLNPTSVGLSWWRTNCGFHSCQLCTFQTQITNQHHCTQNKYPQDNTHHQQCPWRSAPTVVYCDLWHYSLAHSVLQKCIQQTLRLKWAHHHYVSF